MSAPLIEVEGLHRRFDKVVAVEDVSFALPAGQVVGLIGANGAGKTTTMRILATLDMPDAGTVRFAGRDIIEYPGEVRRRLGWMPDHYAAYRDTTVWDYLDFFGRAHGLRGPALSQRLAEVADFTDIGPLADRPVDKLSKGQAQRLCLARTLLHDPDLLILDEPTNGLDPEGILEMRDLLKRLKQEEGITILISSHLLSEIEKLVDDVGIIHKGRMLFQGTLAELQSRQRASSLVAFRTSDNTKAAEAFAARQVTIVSKNGSISASGLDEGSVARLNKELVMSGVDVYAIERVEDDLERIFLDVIKS